MKNGSETDVDCGGSCAPATRCANGKMCAANSDCTSANCASLTCSALGCQTCWKVQYKNANPTGMQSSEQNFNIVSIGSTAVPLSELTIRYWFDTDSQPSTATPDCWWASINCTNTTRRIVAVTPPRVGATHYLEIGFVTSAPTLGVAPGQTGEIQTAFHYDAWSTVNRTNDYSYDATKTNLTDWTRVTLYHNGNQVWGTEPP